MPLCLRLLLRSKLLLEKLLLASSNNILLGSTSGKVHVPGSPLLLLLLLMYFGYAGHPRLMQPLVGCGRLRRRTRDRRDHRNSTGV